MTPRCDIRIILVDDHDIFRAGLKALIEKEPLLRVAAEADNGRSLLSLLPGTPCDVIVLDLSMPQMDGMKTLKALQEHHPDIPVLVLTMQKDRYHCRAARQYGARGYVLKDDAYEQLVLALKKIVNGQSYVSPSIASLNRDAEPGRPEQGVVPALEILTPREQEVLKAVAEGFANKNIARKLKISQRTVEAHRAHLSQKLGIRNTAGLVKFAVDKGLV